MSKSIKKIVIIAFFALLLVSVLTACSDNNVKGDYDYLVTFNYNVGTINAKLEDEYLGVKKGGLVAIQPGYNKDNFPLYEISEHYIAGWYLPELDKNGNVLVDEETKTVVLGKEWNFATDIVESDITLYAKLLKRPVLTYVDGATGDVLGNPTTDKYVGDKITLPSSVVAPKKEGYTLYEYYVDEAMTEAVAWPYVLEGDAKIYVKFIEGTWNIVTDVKSFKAARQNNKNIYLDADLDFAGQNWVAGSYDATLNGNGHTISNISYSMEGNKSNNKGFGLFSSLGQKANIYDLNISGLNLTFEAKMDGIYKVGTFAYEAKQGAKIRNVTITGSLEYDFSKALISSAYPWIAEDYTEAEDVSGVDYSGVELVDKNNK